MNKLLVLFLSYFCIIPFSFANNHSIPSDDSRFPGMPLRIAQNVQFSELGEAPPLTQLYVNAVSSSNVPEGEAIAAGQAETTRHHGGKFIYAITIEIGYSSNHVTIMNGHTLPVTSMIRVNPLCQGPKGKIEFCRIGDTAIGFMRTWDVSFYGNGEFYNSSTSTNFPQNTLTTKLYIK